MKAGTSQKMLLTALSTAVMVRLGKVHRNLMVDVAATNVKLRVRAERIVGEATGAEPAAVRSACSCSIPRDVRSSSAVTGWRGASARSAAVRNIDSATTSSIWPPRCA